ncbi:TIGR02186 family protein, partial [Paracoccaceae bacterium]|nr:TIGR02186 family protein [Paracoccaceae bacterium]
SSDLSSTINDTEDLRYKVSIPRAIRSVGAPMDVSDAASFSDAVIRIRSNQGLYQLLENTVDIDEQTLFRTYIDMPADISDGDYTARILLTRNGNVIDEFTTIIDVRKVGLERFLFNMSRENPLAYGLMSIAIAIFAGWAASLLFRFFRAT